MHYEHLSPVAGATADHYSNSCAITELTFDYYSLPQSSAAGMRDASACVPTVNTHPRAALWALIDDPQTCIIRADTANGLAYVLSSLRCHALSRHARVALVLGYEPRASTDR